jgi:hypothetical protein
MRPLDTTKPLLRAAQIPAGVYFPGVALPGVQHVTPSFTNGQMFDVSAWSSWRLVGQINAHLMMLIVNFWESADNPANGLVLAQSIALPEASSDSFNVLGTILGPLMSVSILGQANDSLGLLEMFVSNRTRLYDAPYTPAALGTILAAIPQTSVPAGGDSTIDLPYYLGPARLSGYFDGSTVPTSIARVIDDNSQVLGFVSPTSSSVADLWVPSRLLTTPATKWQLDVFNDSAAPLAMEAILTAA